MRREPAVNALTFWGHASVFLDVEGFAIVTDPVYEASYSPMSRRKIPVPPATALLRVRRVLISHAHRDHLSPDTIARLPAEAVILCPEPAVEHLAGLGRTVDALRPGDVRAYPGGTITAVVADHASGRNSLGDELDGGALGYVITTPGGTIYWSGDTRYFDGLAAIGAQHRPAVALLDVNGHLNGDDAVRAARAIGAPLIIPIHHGAYTGRNDARVAGWHRELRAALGAAVRSIEPGDGIPLAELFAGRPR